MTEKEVIILAIESSCDETSVAVVKNGDTVLSNVVASQIKSHMRFGGVVPEVASRHHVEQITQVIEAAMDEANMTFAAIDAIAVTDGPGIGRFLVDRGQCSEGTRFRSSQTAYSGQPHRRAYLCESVGRTVAVPAVGFGGERWPYGIGLYGKRWFFRYHRRD